MSCGNLSSLPSRHSCRQPDSTDGLRVHGLGLGLELGLGPRRWLGPPDPRAKRGWQDTCRQSQGVKGTCHRKHIQIRCLHIHCICPGLPSIDSARFSAYPAAHAVAPIQKPILTSQAPPVGAWLASRPLLRPRCGYRLPGS